jgi:hypothetical protein
MNYEEASEHIQQRYKARSGRPLPENELNELIALVEQLPCRGGEVLDFAVTGGLVRSCPHCIWLTSFRREKSRLEAKRSSTPTPP